MNVETQNIASQGTGEPRNAETQNIASQGTGEPMNVETQNIASPGNREWQGSAKYCVSGNKVWSQVNKGYCVYTGWHLKFGC